MRATKNWLNRRWRCVAPFAVRVPPPRSRQPCGARLFLYCRAVQCCLLCTRGKTRVAKNQSRPSRIHSFGTKSSVYVSWGGGPNHSANTVYENSAGFPYLRKLCAGHLAPGLSGLAICRVYDLCNRLRQQKKQRGYVHNNLVAARFQKKRTGLTNSETWCEFHFCGAGWAAMLPAWGVNGGGAEGAIAPKILAE